MPGHVIHKQVLEIAIQDKAHANQAQDAIGYAYKERWLKILERIFDEEISPDQVISLDRLEIELELQDWPDLTQVQAVHFEDKLRSALHRVLRQEAHEGTLSTAANGYPSVKLAAASESTFLQVLVNYMETGRIPILSRERETFIQTLNARIQALQDDPALRHLLQELAPNALARLVRQLHPEVLELVIKRLLKAPAPSWTTFMTHVKKMFEALPPQVIRPALQGRIEGSIKQALIRHAAVAGSAQLTHLAELVIAVGVTAIGQSDAEATPVYPAIEHYAQAYFGLEPVYARKIIAKLPDSLAVHKALAKSRATKTAQFADETEGLLVHSAGAVLLWPYLPPLFKAYGWVEDGDFVNADSRQFAIQTLAWLSLADDLADEDQLTAFKVICGMHPEDFCEFEHMLSAEIRGECEHLLTQVVKNWSALKNTSPDALRQSFLQRPGLLLNDVNGWRLQVEKQAMDVLLERLTWPIATIKLPWNDYLIHVDWS